MRLTDEQAMQDNKRFANCNALAELKYCGLNIPHRKSITNDEIHFYAWLCRSAVVMLKEQEDLGTELTNAMELIHKKNERIKKLEEQIETLTRWRTNAGAFD